MTPINATVSFDMHSPEWATPTAELYAEALEMAAFADQIGVDRIGLMEHHGCRSPLSWQAGDTSNSPFKGLDKLEALRRSGMFAVWTVDELIANADKGEDRGTFGFQPLVAGARPRKAGKAWNYSKPQSPN